MHYVGFTNKNDLIRNFHEYFKEVVNKIYKERLSRSSQPSHLKEWLVGLWTVSIDDEFKQIDYQIVFFDDGTFEISGNIYKKDLDRTKPVSLKSGTYDFDFPRIRLVLLLICIQVHLPCPLKKYVVSDITESSFRLSDQILSELYEFLSAQSRGADLDKPKLFLN